MNTVVEERERIVEWLRDQDRWVGVTEVAAWMEATLGISRTTGQNDLRALVNQGRIERRATRPGEFYRRYEYRAC